jgi:predicted ATPase/class 3 adenylate cyclase
MPPVGRDLSSGTVTFLFTDIEGSTKLLHELGAQAYSEALGEHRRTLRDAFARHGGVEIDTQGDAFFCSFPTAEGAVEAARESQEALLRGPIRVRMGIHTGTPHLGEEGYVGEDVHKGARIAAAAHGGQVVLSQETREQVETEVTDLGEHRLKDFNEPVWIYQVGTERFPPLKTISNTNLPRPASSFVGRDREVTEVASLLRDGARLLTLTGPGGSGKTRLAIEAASEVVPDHRNGTFWVELAPLRDPALVIEEVAKTVGAKDGLAEHISDRDMLLVLDNLEQVIEAAPELVSLVESCPNLRLLTTSRELLRIRGEVEYPVPPLADPEAVELFCARSGLEPNEAIAELCRRLDNLPLAVELAAARTRVLSPAQILERLSGRLDLLKGGRDADRRQVTLRATIEWSQDLLSEEEKALFARLSVFRGGCTLEAAEEVAVAHLDTLQSLVDKSLLRHTGDRFWMLETIREYAGEQLARRADEAQVRDRHLHHFVALAERAHEARFASESTWVPFLEADHDNIRAALDWARVRHPDVEGQLAGAVAYYWGYRGHGLEGRERITGALARYPSRDRIRARLLMYLGDLVGEAGDDRGALSYLGEALQIWRDVGEARDQAEVLDSMGYCQIALEEEEAARASFEESLALRRRSGVGEEELVRSMAGLCQLFVATGQVDRVQPLAEELYEVGERLQAARPRQWALHYLADSALIAGDFEEAKRRYLRGLAHARRSGHVTMCVEELVGFAMSTAGTGDLARAVRLASAAYAQRKALGVASNAPFWDNLQDRFIGGARARLSPEKVEQAESAGTAVPFDAVLDEVLGTEDA